MRPTASWLPRLELALGLLLTSFVAVLHCVFFGHAGALWRDEISSVNLASLPSTSDVLANNHLDSFPVGWPLLLRSWIALGFGASDSSLRGLGLAIGLAVLAALWWCARRFGYRVPLFSLALLALNPTLFVFGDTLRGYGLGVLGLLLVLLCTWSLVEDPRLGTFLRAALAALIAVQCMYPNSGMLLAVSLGAWAVCLVARKRNAALLVALVGILALASMLPYLATMARLQRWTMIVQGPVDLAGLLWKFTEALGATRPEAAEVYVGLLLVSLVVAARYRRESSSPSLFLGVASVAALACHFAYLMVLRVPTQSWYYLGPMVVAAVCIDAGIDRLVSSSARARIVRLLAVTLFAIWVAPGAWSAAHVRMTTVDRAAAAVAERAAPDDLVLLNPWYAASTLARYDRGPCAWITIPDFDERRFQPYEAFKAKMSEKDPIRPVLDRIAATLRAGHSVWLIGTLPRLAPGEQPGDLPPAPDARIGWSEGAYSYVWTRQVGFLVRTRATSFTAVPIAFDGPTFVFETLPVAQIRGWRGP